MNCDSPHTSPREFCHPHYSSPWYGNHDLLKETNILKVIAVNNPSKNNIMDSSSQSWTNLKKGDFQWMSPIEQSKKYTTIAPLSLAIKKCYKINFFWRTKDHSKIKFSVVPYLLVNKPNKSPFLMFFHRLIPPPYPYLCNLCSNKVRN